MKLKGAIFGLAFVIALAAAADTEDDGSSAAARANGAHSFLRHASDRGDGRALEAGKGQEGMLDVSPDHDFMDTRNPAFSNSVWKTNPSFRDLAGANQCIKTKVDFSESATGQKLRRGMYVKNEWKQLGLSLSSLGGYGSRPRIFDTSNPGTKEYGDPDLGSPNQRCKHPGPGVGEGGEPDVKGANCDYLGNVLIIQEDNDNKSIPDDNVDGGTMIFEFSREGQYVYDIGLLDVDYTTSILVKYRPANGNLVDKQFVVPILGDNSVQTVRINLPNVVTLKVVASRSAAVTFITFCRTSNEVRPPPQPSRSPPQPSRSPPQPSRSPPQACVSSVIDFSKTARGTPLKGGFYVRSEWRDLGLTLSASGGFGSLPRLFDTSNPGTKKAGDPDLGSPNEHCPKRGPGTGEGGVPGAKGENCEPLGNVLIIQERNDNMAIPDDNVKGGVITFDFAEPLPTVNEMGLLDVDYPSALFIVYKSGSRTKERTISVPLLGDNSFQKVSINQASVVQIRLENERSGAVTHLSLCSFASGEANQLLPVPPPVEPTPPPVTPAPVVVPTPSPTPAPVSPTPPPVTPPTTPAPVDTDAPTPEPTPAPVTPPPTTPPPTTPPPTTPPPTTPPPTTPPPTTPPPTTPPPTTPPPTTPAPTPEPTPAPMPGGLALETSLISVDRGESQVFIDVVRTEGSDGQVSVDYMTQPDTATPGDDYIAKSGTLVFDDGETQQSIVISLVSGTEAQPTEDFKITIDNPQGADLLAPRTATVTLVGQEVVTTEEPVVPTDPEPRTFTIVPVDLITGLTSPTKIVWLPDSTMLIATKPGVVRVADASYNLLSTPFIDISAIVNNRNDRGLISIAVHPNFVATPYVYLLYAYEGTESSIAGLGEFAGADGKGARAGRVMRCTADVNNAYRTIVPGSEFILLGKNSIRQYFNPFVDLTVDFDEPQGGFVDGEYVEDFINSDSLSHSVGDLAFLPDGSLLVSTGDGASYNRVDVRAFRCMDVNSLAGKVLRVDPITGEGLPSNPYYSQTNNPNANSAKVYQLGIRNSWRMTVSESGQFFLGEVGWTTWEEINTGGPGANYGWPYYEGGSQGSEVLKGYADTPEGQAFAAQNVAVTAPFYALNHNTGINAIVLGDMLSSSNSYYGGKYKGDLFYADLGKGIVSHITLNGAGQVQSVGEFTTGAVYVVHIVEGPDGILYYVDLNDGKIGRWETS